MKAFFDHVRRHFGALSQSQVDGFMAILIASQSAPMRHRAYMLATAWHEVAKTMQPIREFGLGKGKKYGLPTGPYMQTYYGRGLVQLTWLDNYAKATRRLREMDLIGPDVDLVKNPDLALDPKIAVHILVVGMSEGWFTGKRLGDFTSYVSMRAVVNGSDKAALIAGHAEVFEDALIALAATVVDHPEPSVSHKQPDDPGVEAAPPAKTSSANLAKLVGALMVAAIAGLIAFVTGLIGGN